MLFFSFQTKIITRFSNLKMERCQLKFDNIRVDNVIPSFRFQRPLMKRTMSLLIAHLLRPMVRRQEKQEKDKKIVPRKVNKKRYNLTKKANAKEKARENPHTALHL